LLVDVHDSDITTVTYRPCGPGSGTAYLGLTPRTYLEDESKSAPTDVPREAAGLAAWWQLVHGISADSAAGKADEIASFLAADEDASTFDELDDEDEPEIDDADMFVEIKTSRFLHAMGLPVPPMLPDWERGYD
jgi:hypothetical protein